MTQKELSLLIPDEYRKEILLTNMINKAQAVEGDVVMNYLFTVWKNYVEPTIIVTCNLCLARVLDNYKALQETFIQMEKESQLLKEV